MSQCDLGCLSSLGMRGRTSKTPFSGQRKTHDSEGLAHCLANASNRSGGARLVGIAEATPSIEIGILGGMYEQ